MKKTSFKKILALTIVFMMFISTPISVFNISINNPYAYAAGTFNQMLDSNLFEQVLIATGISAGLVFYNVEEQWAFTDEMKTYFRTLGSNFKPEGPEGPDLEQFIKNSLIFTVVYNAGIQGLKLLSKIDDAFWHLVRNRVNDMYDVGENSTGDGIVLEEYDVGDIIHMSNTIESTNIVSGQPKVTVLKTILFKGHLLEYQVHQTRIDSKTVETNFKVYKVEENTFHPQKTIYQYRGESYNLDEFYEITLMNGRYLLFSTSYPENEQGDYIYEEPKIIIGTQDIVDNPNYDWNNNYTDTKVIPIPIEMDPYGNPKKDENGYYLPSTDVDEWLDVQPTEIPNLDPTGTPIPDIPPFPDIENPDDDEQTGIMIYIGNILQLIVGQLSKIADGVKTIVSNTNQLVFNTPNPIFDPTTGEQIDPETGEPIAEPVPEPMPGDGIIGDGIDTNIPTDFEWGDFKHLIDIFFIFIYFIVILILILLKFLNVVFMSLPSIPANTELFNQYPEILEGVNFVKNLKVGGMSITVQQSFEMIFLIFFFIFAIKQIRKLYGASVFEQAAESKRNTRDMKMDYYENSQHYSPNNFSKGMLYSQEQNKSKKNKSLYNDDDYENIHFDGF